MPHFDEMPSVSDDTGPPMLSSQTITARPPFELPSHVRHSHEKLSLNGNARTNSYTSIRGSLNEKPESFMDGTNGGKFGDMPNDTSLNAMPNGRLSVSSWDHKSSRNGSMLSVNGGMNGTLENGRRSPGPHNGMNRLSNGDKNSNLVASTTVLHSTEGSPMKPTPPTSNGNAELAKRISIPPPISTSAQSTGPLTYTSSLLPATPMSESSSPSPTPPARASTASPHRFSSPPTYPSPLGPSQSTHSLPHPGTESLKHRHTLQVPRAGGPPRTSRDGDESFTTGRFSPSAARRGSMSLNRRHTQSIHSNMPHEEVVMDDDAIRWADAVKQKRASKRKRKEDEDDDRVVVGTKVDINHVNWVTAYNMLTGIRFTVSRTNAKVDRELTDADFDASHKFSFDITGNELTPSAKYDFKFKDYAPWVFRHLRASFKLDPADYLMSLTSKYILSELGSPGKSGSFFYFSRDYKYIIKTIHHAEHKFLRKILREYYAHVDDNPNTLLSQFYGLHRVKIPYGRKVHFVVMNNLFPPHRDIHQTFDLKGSTVGRDFKEEDLEKNPRATLKDQNWNRRNLHLEFGPQKKHLFIDQMERDVRLLQKLQIMDYSMLVGIHDLQKGNQENIRDQTLQVFNPGGDNPPDEIYEGRQSLVRTPSKMESARKARELRQAIKQEKPIPMGQSSNRMPDQMEENKIKRDFIFYSEDGGFRATHQDDTPGEEIFYLSIIDCLTHYGSRKKFEHFFKGYLLGENKHEISPIRPEPYGERFLNYISRVTKSQEEAAAEVIPNAQSRSNSNRISGLDRTSILQREKDEVRRSTGRVDGLDEMDPRTLSTVRSPSVERSGHVLPVVEELGEASSTGGRSGRSRDQDDRPVTPARDRGLDDRPPTPAKDASPHMNGNGLRKAVSRISLDKDLPPLPLVNSPDPMENWR